MYACVCVCILSQLVCVCVCAIHVCVCVCVLMRVYCLILCDSGCTSILVVENMVLTWLLLQFSVCGPVCQYC